MSFLESDKESNPITMVEKRGTSTDMPTTEYCCELLDLVHSSSRFGICCSKEEVDEQLLQRARTLRDAGSFPAFSCRTEEELEDYMDVAARL